MSCYWKEKVNCVDDKNIANIATIVHVITVIFASLATNRHYNATCSNSFFNLLQLFNFTLLLPVVKFLVFLSDSARMIAAEKSNDNVQNKILKHNLKLSNLLYDHKKRISNSVHLIMLYFSGTDL